MAALRRMSRVGLPGSAQLQAGASGLPPVPDTQAAGPPAARAAYHGTVARPPSQWPGGAVAPSPSMPGPLLPRQRPVRAGGMTQSHRDCRRGRPGSRHTVAGGLVRLLVTTQTAWTVPATSTFKFTQWPLQ